LGITGPSRLAVALTRLHVVFPPESHRARCHNNEPSDSATIAAVQFAPVEVGSVNGDDVSDPADDAEVTATRAA